MANIIFISDQFYPRTSADSEQIISSLSALGKISDTTLLSARYFFSESPSKSSLQNYYSKKATFELEFITHLFPSIRGIEKIIFAIRSAFFVRGKEYELVYTRNIPVLIFCLIFTKCSLLFESYRPWPNRNYFAKNLFKFFSKNQRLLGVILHSEYAGNSFAKVGFKDKKLLVAHNAFDLSAYKDVESNLVRKKYDIPLDKLLVTYSGRVNKKKGLQKMLNLAEEFGDILFLIIGSEKFGEIEKKAQSISNVKVLGWLDKKTVFSILQASDVLYIPPTLQARDKAKNTVLPLKTFIYKASGTAIFGPKAEDIEEVLSHKHNAYLVEPDDSKKEIEGFRILSSDENLRNDLGKRAKNEMLDLTWDNRAISILGFIKSNSL